MDAFVAVDALGTRKFTSEEKTAPDDKIVWLPSSDTLDDDGKLDAVTKQVRVFVVTK
jgi:hypothetical protein